MCSCGAGNCARQPPIFEKILDVPHIEDFGNAASGDYLDARRYCWQRCDGRQNSCRFSGLGRCDTPCRAFLCAPLRHLCAIVRSPSCSAAPANPAAERAVFSRHFQHSFFVKVQAMTPFTPVASVITLAVAALLAGCGGGGGTPADDTVQPAAPAPQQPAVPAAPQQPTATNTPAEPAAPTAEAQPSTPALAIGTTPAHPAGTSGTLHSLLAPVARNLLARTPLHSLLAPVARNPLAPVARSPLASTPRRSQQTPLGKCPLAPHLRNRPL